MSELPSLAGLPLGAPTGMYASTGIYFDDDLREEFKDLVTTAMELDEMWWGTAARRITAQKPRCSKYSPFPYSRFDRAMAGHYDRRTEEGQVWVATTAVLFWQHYLNPILIGPKDVASRMHTSDNKIDTLRTLVKNEWMPALKAYIAEHDKNIVQDGAGGAMRGVGA